jgi:RNA-directed DNA polymerase
MPDSSLLNALASAFLAGEPAVEPIVDRCSQTLGKRWRWLRPLARRYLEAIAHRSHPRHREVVRFLRDDKGFRRVGEKYAGELALVQRLVGASHMYPVGAAAAWDLPAIESVGALADWFRLTVGELLWFADLKALGYKTAHPQLRHYHYRILSKCYGNIRLIEAPKPRLKQLQQQILTGILDLIPPHPSAHGFIKGRSIKTFVAPHVRRRVVVRMDVRDFFPSLRGARIQALFRTMGYPEAVADLLGGVCTNAAPRDVWSEPGEWREARMLYAQPHLPQGAPTSPALANMCVYRADCRLTGLAEAAGASYSRYADDLAFSGGEEFDRRVERFAAHVAAILHEEGFAVHFRKTRVMRQGVRQHLAGIVANQRLNVRRIDYDRLKATLTNCVRLGAASQNREAHPDFRAHLEGRVAFVAMINPEKAARLRQIFERIQWASS